MPFFHEPLHPHLDPVVPSLLSLVGGDASNQVKRLSLSLRVPRALPQFSQQSDLREPVWFPYLSHAYDIVGCALVASMLSSRPASVRASAWDMMRSVLSLFYHPMSEGGTGDGLSEIFCSGLASVPT